MNMVAPVSDVSAPTRNNSFLVFAEIAEIQGGPKKGEKLKMLAFKKFSRFFDKTFTVYCVLYQPSLVQK